MGPQGEGSERCARIERADSVVGFLIADDEGNTLVTSDIRIPEELKPADGRFGAGPSKVRPEAVAALATEGAKLLGTSRRSD